jgi:hypothetical protein
LFSFQSSKYEGLFSVIWGTVMPIMHAARKIMMRRIVVLGEERNFLIFFRNTLYYTSKYL